MIMMEASSHFAIKDILFAKDILTELLSVSLVVSNCVSSLMWVMRIADSCIGLEKTADRLLLEQPDAQNSHLRIGKVTDNGIKRISRSSDLKLKMSPFRK